MSGAVVLALALLAAPAAAGERAPLLPPEPLPLAWCLERALEANPAVAVSAAEADAARERVGPAGALEDPRLGYEAANLPVHDLAFDVTPMSGHQLTLAQKLPFPGVLGSREDAAREAARAREADHRDRRLGVAARVEAAWAELGFAQRALDITDRNLDLLRHITRIAETKYAVGTGLQQDVLRAQVELTRLVDERLAREARVARAEARLAALLDAPPGSRFPRTAPLAESHPVPDGEALLARLEDTSPRLRARVHRVAEAERRVRTAELEGYPDFDLGLGYRVRESSPADPVDGDDFVTAGVKVRLPLDRSKWRARVAEARALLRRARSEHRGELADLRAAVRSQLAELRRADAAVRLLEDGLVPQSRQSLESSRAGYEVDKVDFLSLVDSQVSLLEAELALVRAQADHRVAFARLEAAVGEGLR